MLHNLGPNLAQIEFSPKGKFLVNLYVTLIYLLFHIMQLNISQILIE